MGPGDSVGAQRSDESVVGPMSLETVWVVSGVGLMGPETVWPGSRVGPEGPETVWKGPGVGPVGPETVWPWSRDSLGRDVHSTNM